MTSLDYQFNALAAQASPTCRQFYAPATIPEFDESDSSTIEFGQWINFRMYTLSWLTTPTSPTYNLVKGVAQQILSNNAIKENGRATDFEFENVQVKPWEGKKIHDDGMDDLEFTLGSGKDRNKCLKQRLIQHNSLLGIAEAKEHIFFSPHLVTFEDG